MIKYKGWIIWYNALQGYMVQEGYQVVKVCKTESAAKAYITRTIGE